MNSNEIANILSKNRFTKECFRGVYSSNNIISQYLFPYCLVVNTDKEGQPGTHWVAIYVNNNKEAEYFDSFGKPPNDEIAKFLNQFELVHINKNKIQSNYDTSCGPHVIYYLIQKCRGNSLNTIIKELNSSFSDSLVKMFVYHLIKL